MSVEPLKHTNSSELTGVTMGKPTLLEVYRAALIHGLVEGEEKLGAFSDESLTNNVHKISWADEKQRLLQSGTQKLTNVVSKVASPLRKKYVPAVRLLIHCNANAIHSASNLYDGGSISMALLTSNSSHQVMSSLALKHRIQCLHVIIRTLLPRHV